MQCVLLQSALEAWCARMKLLGNSMAANGRFLGRIVRCFVVAVLLQLCCQQCKEAGAEKTGTFRFEKTWTISVRGGLLKGRIWSLGEKKFSVFKGVPYAEPPIGDNRFRKPKTVPHWSGTREALDYGAPCIQFMEYHLHDKYSGPNMQHESEDCLFLNIFAPYEEGSGSRYPILFWIHGGSFLAGSSDTGIDEEICLQNVVQKNVVVITINYRLGPFGFLSSELAERRGNIGLWDQVEALRWVHENILFFGGDPSRVTIIGESAGGASASILALSPVTVGLVQQAVIMSGSAVAGWSIQRGEEAKWNLRNLVDYLTCQKKMDPADITESYSNASVDLLDENGCLKLSRPFDCSTDLDTESLWTCFGDQFNISEHLLRKVITHELGVSKAVVDDELIPTNATYLLQTAPRLPILTGVAELEWGHKKAIFYGFRGYSNVTEKQAREKVDAIMKSSLRDTLYEEKVSDSTLELVGNVTFYHYISKDHPTPPYNLSDFLERLRRIESDIEFVTPCSLEAEAYASKGLSVYLYTFDHAPDEGLIEEEQVDVDFFGQQQAVKTFKKRKFKSAFHGLDHGYIFSPGYSSNNQVVLTDKDLKLANDLSTVITNFVKNGNPGLEKVNRQTWPKYNNAERQFVRIQDGEFKPQRDFYTAQTQFWTQLSSKMANYVSADAEDAPSRRGLNDEERTQLVAYKKAWWALWLLVAVIAFVLWIVVICIIARRCIGKKPYKNVAVTNA